MRDQDVTPTYAPSRPGDIPHLLADLTRARRDVGSEPLVGVRVGLRLSLGYDEQADALAEPSATSS